MKEGILMKNLEEYLSKNFFNRIIDHSIRAKANSNDEVAFYIHPINANGDTLDFQVIGNTLIPLTNDLTKPEALDFGQALCLCKRGVKVVRKGWNDTKLYVHIVHNAVYPQLDKSNGSKLSGIMASFIVIHTSDSYDIPWVPNQNDMLANDWSIVK